MTQCHIKVHIEGISGNYHCKQEQGHPPPCVIVVRRKDFE